MPAISLPFNIANGDPLDADAVMADFQGIVATVNGGLEMGPNVKAAAAPSPITGKDSGGGVSVSGLRSDAQFVIQGVENVTAKPTTGNFLGRMVYVTAGGDIGKAFICTNATTPIWLAFANQGATDVALHAAQHADGGLDQLTDTSIAERSMKARTIATATIPSSHANISGSAFSDIVDLAITTTGIQTIMGVVNMQAHNTSGTVRSVYGRVVDVTASSATIFGPTSTVTLGAAGSASDALPVGGTFFYTTPAGGARTLRVQAGASAASAVDIQKPAGQNGDATVPPTISAVIV